MRPAPQDPERHIVTPSTLFWENCSISKTGATVNSASSAVPSNRQYLHAGETVRVLWQHHGVAVHTDLTEAWSQVVGVIGPTEGVYVDIGNVVVLNKKIKR